MLIKKLIESLKQGRLLDSIVVRLGGTPLVARVKYFGAKNVSQAAKALSIKAKLTCIQSGENAWVLVVGEGGLQEVLCRQLSRRRVMYQVCTIRGIREFTGKENAPVLVLSGYQDMKHNSALACELASSSHLANVPYEYAANLDADLKLFRQFDEYGDTNFVSPLLLEEKSPYKIYQESLGCFEQKCGFRDYLDLYQMIKLVIGNGVDGDIAEFGSYKGHSGWLIAKTLEVLGSDKRLFMFDTFEAFPIEELGVDAFWSKTHMVDFEEVRRKFTGFENVTLIQGDFTKTLSASEVNKLALGYVDCDSYRASKYLIEVLMKDYLSDGGVLICEDYGHPALLGSRLAVQEAVKSLRPKFTFFSQFSGLYVALK